MMYESDRYEDGGFRYRVVRYEELPESHKQSRIEAGLDPVSKQVVSSFYDVVDAFKDKTILEEEAPSFWTYEVIDVEDNLDENGMVTEYRV